MKKGVNLKMVTLGHIDNSRLSGKGFRVEVSQVRYFEIADFLLRNEIYILYQTICLKLDPVGSTVRYKVMKPMAITDVTWSMEGNYAFIY